LAWGLWSSEAESANGIITAGDLDLELGPFSWAQTTDSVQTAERQTGASPDSLADFVAAAGDQIEIQQEITTFLSGDNLEAELSLWWNGATPSGWSGAFQLRTAAGELVGQAEIGQSLALPAWAVATTADDSSETGWTVQVELVIDPPVYIDPTNPTAVPTADPTAWGGLILSLNQVRGQAAP
jgi:alternate signal-mediated exported protein